jgi:hypothetical protein
MPKFLIEALAILGAASAGLGVFFVIFSAPAWFYGNEILLAWGWFSWIPGLPIGYWVGSFVRKLIRKTFLPSADSEPEQTSRAWLFLAGIGFLVFAGVTYTGVFTDLWLVGIPFLLGLFILVAACAASDSFVQKMFSSLKLF